MGVATSPDKVTYAQTANLRNHVREQGIAGNIKRNAQEHICTALIKLAGQLAILYKKLEQGMAGWQGNRSRFFRIPARYN